MRDAVDLNYRHQAAPRTEPVRLGRQIHMHQLEVQPLRVHNANAAVHPLRLLKCGAVPIKVPQRDKARLHLQWRLFLYQIRDNLPLCSIAAPFQAG